MNDRDRVLEKLKLSAFMDSNAAFLGCLLCHLNFEWDTSISTACVSDSTFKWNPLFFDSLTLEERKFILFHELWHIALLHLVRCEGRDHKRWNIACDAKINAMLLKQEGIQMPKGGIYYPEFDDPQLTEEEIYDQLPTETSSPSWGYFSPSNNRDAITEQVAMVQSAIKASSFSDEDNSDVINNINKFLKPKVPWYKLLRKYVNDLGSYYYNWKRPNKRFRNIYLPRNEPDIDSLENISIYLDTSGSVDDSDVQRFISEIKYIQDNLKPKTLHIYQFNTKIVNHDIYTREKPFKTLNIYGRGGTDLEDVHKSILKTKPTFSIIFTDLYCEPMESVGRLKVLWIINSEEVPPFGDKIYV